MLLGGLSDMAIISWKKKPGKNLVMVEETDVDEFCVHGKVCGIFFQYEFQGAIFKIWGRDRYQVIKIEGLHLFIFSRYKTSRHPALPSHVWCFRTF